MFDFDAGKLLIIGIVALIFIPSKDLPRVLRQLGQFVGKMRRMAAEFQGQFMDAMREADMADLKREAETISKAAATHVGLDEINAINAQVMGALDGKPALSATQAAVLGAESETAMALQETSRHDAAFKDKMSYDDTIALAALPTPAEPLLGSLHASDVRALQPVGPSEPDGPVSSGHRGA